MTHQSLILSVLQHVTADRLQRAVCGLADGSLTMTITRQSEAEIRALVKNGDGKEYGVTLTESLSTCSCKDALYRGTVCKHAVAVALYVLRTPQPQKAAPAPQFPTFHLMWRDGIVLCGEHHPGRVQVAVDGIYGDLAGSVHGVCERLPTAETGPCHCRVRKRACETGMLTSLILQVVEAGTYHELPHSLFISTTWPA